MIVITIQGMPESAAEDAPQLIKSLREAAVGVDRIPIEFEDVVVFFPVDLVQKGLGEKLIVKVEVIDQRALNIPIPALGKLEEAIYYGVDSFVTLNLKQCQMIAVRVEANCPRIFKIHKLAEQ